jgi:hypothetical protein
MDDLHHVLEQLEEIHEQKRALSEREKLLKTMLLAEMRARGIKRITLGAERICAKLQLKLDIRTDKGEDEE